MTQKAVPTAPKTTSEKLFWEGINKIKVDISNEVFGQKAGKGGSILKDSLLLAKTIHDRISVLNIHYDLVAENVTVIPTIIPAMGREPESPGFLASGNYEVRWFINGELVYLSKAFGAFDEKSSTKAVHGAITCARTDVFFTMFQASTKSEEQFEQDRLNALNRQEPRNPANPLSVDDKPY